jgi:hypothetical protein
VSFVASSPTPAGSVVSEVEPPAQSKAEVWWRWSPVALGAGALVLVYVRDPNQSGSYGFCPLRALTGWDCPFCGGLRGTHDLLHGDVASALDHNLLLPLYLVALVAGGVALLRGGSPGRSRLTPRGRVALWTLIAVTAVFFVMRNLPWFPYLDSAA